MGSITHVKKRDGRIVPFDQTKIADAIFKAVTAIGGEDREMAEELADVVALFLEKHYPGRIPGIEDIQDMVEKVLIETGHAKTARAYIRYRDKRAALREKAVVWKRVRATTDVTDRQIEVQGQAVEVTSGWDRRRIVDALIREAEVSRETAEEIASVVEKRVLGSGLQRVSTALVRELVDNELFERGLSVQLERQAVIGMPKYDLDQLILSKSNDNSNIAQHNPEAINLAIAENTLKQYALQQVFSTEVTNAHRRGFIHLHDLGYPTRVYCSSHSIEYIKKYGLHLENLEVDSAPARHAATLTGHLNTFLASMQAYYAGALGVAYINIMYAPFVEEMSDEEMHQEAQHLIFSSSQNAFSRGGQTLFLDFNIHTGIPGYLRTVPAIGPGGKYTGRTYGDYEEPAKRFTRAMLQVWREGDEHGHIFPFPKCDFHVNGETFSDPSQREIFDLACQIASENGVPYFVFDRDEVTLSACCRLRTKVEDKYMIEHPESMRFCGFQNVTINLPQCAYRAGGANGRDFDRLFEGIERAMELAMNAHIQKKEFARRLMASPEMPLWEVGRIAADGRPYIDLDTSTYIIGIIGLNECLKHLTGKELHEGFQPLYDGLRVITFMYYKAKELGRRYGLKVMLEESPAESTSRRLAKLDSQHFPSKANAVLQGKMDRDEMYYTNSVHMRPDAPVDFMTRIRLQAKFHPLIESGAIIHAFVGEKRPSGASIAVLVKRTFEKTHAAQLTISPEFTTCDVCGATTDGLVGRCPKCGTANVAGVERLAEVEIEDPVRSRKRLLALASRQSGGKVREPFDM